MQSPKVSQSAIAVNIDSPSVLHKSGNCYIARSFDEFNQWAIEDKKIYGKIVNLIKDIQRDPFSGLGKPEALKHHPTSDSFLLIS